MTPVGVAIVGCGTISGQYLTVLTGRPEVRVVACADLDTARAAAVAARFGVPASGDLATVLAMPEVELVINLTVPAAHHPVALAAIGAGKHVYNEKPFAPTPVLAADILARAHAAGVLTGGAPDTFLGTGLQTAARAVAQGRIGVPLSAIALFQSPGPESWHHQADFYYQPGGGPLFDMGPYYLTALAVLFGPARRVGALARQGFTQRVLGSGPRAGQSFPVRVPTHVTALLEYAGGQVATVVFSFDSPLPRSTFLEVTGTEATLAAPDPNNFAGEVLLRHKGDSGWSPIAVPEAVQGRGIGVCDMAVAIREGVPYRATGEMAAHIVDVMAAISEAADTGRHVAIGSTFAAPQPMPG